MTTQSTTTKEALEREFDHFSIVPFKAICGADRLGETTTQDPRRAKCSICWQYWNEWEASFYFDARVSALGVKRISGEQWLTERGFADSRTYSNTEIGKLLEEYARISAPIVAPVVDEPLLPQTDYKTKPQLDGKERYKFGHLFHEYTFNNCDHGEQAGRVCKGCVVECFAYLAQRRAPVSTVAPVEQSDGLRAIFDVGFAPSSKRETLRLLDAIEQSIRNLSQPLSPTETATRIQLSAEYGLSYVAALRERLLTDYNERAQHAATTPPSTLAKAAAEEIFELGKYDLDSTKAKSQIAAIIGRHFAPLAADSDDE